ncbi:MAG: hypothetical protein R3Y59_05800 [bacterium]
MGNKKLILLKYINIFTLLTLLFALLSCDTTESDEVSSGTFSFQEKNYPIKSLRVEQQGLSDGEYTLRMTCYPATYSISESSTSGYGTVIDAYFRTPDEDFVDLSAYSLSSVVNDTVFSQLIQYPNSGDTTYFDIASGMLYVDSTETYLEYTIEFITIDGDSIIGSFIGDHTYNYSVDQPSYGNLAFDTLSYELARPILWQWDTLLSTSVFYQELVFYASDARFSDAGKIKTGTQFVLGFNTLIDETLSAGTYPVTTILSDAPALLYGNKINDVSWGSFWQIYSSYSAIAKANITSGEVTINDITTDYINLSFQLTDQLNNSVEGEYDGPMIIIHFE